MSAFAAAVAAEMVKLGRRPANLVLLGAFLLLLTVFRYAIPYSASLEDGGPGRAALAPALPDQLVVNALSAMPVFAGALMLVFGALTVGSEYGWDTMKTVLTQRPSRTAFALAKVAAIALSALLAVVAALAWCALLGAGVALLDGAAMDWPPAADAARGLLAGWLILTVWGLAGGALAFLTRGVALPIGLGVVWILGVENLLSGIADNLLTALQPVRDALPGANAGSLVSALAEGVAAGGPVPGVVDVVGGERAAVTLCCYALGFSLAAVALLRRRDLAG
ncbi:hypothetical protein GCM10022205_01900 [Spinactinospora alkalitolerans]